MMRFSSKRCRIPPLCTLTIVCWLSAAAAAQEDSPLSPGLYRLEMIMTTHARVPFFGISKSSSRSLSLVEIRKEGPAFVQSHRVCDFRVINGGTIKIVFPEMFVAALAKHRYPIELEKDGAGWRYRADLGIERIGYRSPGDDGTLPAAIDDPAVFDWDGDGHPGATLKLSIPLLPDGELYVVQRGHSILNGRLAKGRVEGGVDVKTFEHRVLGAWPPFLNRSPEIQAEPEESRFSLTPLAPGSTCESLRQESR